MIGAVAFLAFVVAQRLGELILARANTRRLLAAGAREHGAGHYWLIVALHAGWLAALVLLGWDRAIHPGWLALFALLQLGRVWLLATLGRRWTTRILTVPGEAAVTTGPFRFMRHPNYAIVVAEIAVAPLVLGLPLVALLFTILNALVLRIRIRAEAAAWRS